MPAECRICLKLKREVSSLFDIDSDSNDPRIYADKISEFASLKISKSDGLPDSICGVCVRTLRSVFVFRQLCRDSDVELRKRHGLSSVEYLEKDLDDVTQFLATSGEISAVTIKHEQLEYEDTDHFDNSFPIDYDTEEVLEVPETDLNALALKRINPDITIVKIEAANVKRPSTRKPRRRKNLDLDETSPKKTHRRRKSDYTGKTFKVKSEYDDTSIRVRTSPCDDEPISPRNVKVMKVLPKMRAERRQFFCEICGKCFDNRTILESHLQRHAGIKPHQCSDCGKAFVLKSELRRHSFIHSGVRPYPCRFCGRPFSDYSSKIKHERCHMNERLYKCEVCGNGFNYSYALKKHMLVHSGAKNFFCTLCQQNFRMKYHLTNHIGRRHKELDRIQKERLMAMGDLVAAITENRNELSVLEQNENISIKVVNDEKNIPQVYVSLGN